MIDTKLSLTFILPGSILLSSQECEENPKQNYNSHTLLLPELKGKGKHRKTVLVPLKFQTRKCRPATQHINVNTDAYNYMLHTPTEPKWTKMVKNKKGKSVRAWDLLSEKERLSHHIKLIAQDLKAISFSYEILED